MKIDPERIRRLHFGYIVAPEGTSNAGQPIPVVGYLIEHPKARILFDTGISPMDEETRQHYLPRGRAIEEVLAGLGLGIGDIDLVANCHLHADHAGGNSKFPKVPVYVQKAELEMGPTTDYTYPEFTFDFPDVRLEVVRGEAEMVPGVRLIPTPGHTPGHQALVVDTRAGRVLLAGQAFNNASEFSFAAFSHRLDAAGLDRIGTFPPWMPRIAALNPQRGYFAHDLLTFEPDSAQMGHPRPM
ncbi:MAG: N-acyl homoserine lactonase family protein [Candidatus Limnocylindria bacterium]